MILYIACSIYFINPDTGLAVNLRIAVGTGILRKSTDDREYLGNQ